MYKNTAATSNLFERLGTKSKNIGDGDCLAPDRKERKEKRKKSWSVKQDKRFNGGGDPASLTLKDTSGKPTSLSSSISGAVGEPGGQPTLDEAPVIVKDYLPAPDGNQRHRSFVIPKRQRISSCLIAVKVDSHEFHNDIERILKQGYHSEASSTNYIPQDAHLIHNTELQNQYLNKKKDLQNEGRTEKEVVDVFAFLEVKSFIEATAIAHEGIKVSNIGMTWLGEPSMGVCLQKYADITRPEQMARGPSLYIVIFKVMKGRIKHVDFQDRGQPHLEPTPNYDCHVFKGLPHGILRSDVKHAFYATQYYLYEYGEDSIEPKPRHVCPYAIVTLKYKPSSASSKARHRAKRHGKSEQSKKVTQSAKTKDSAAESLIWHGWLTNKGKTVAAVELVSLYCFLRPAQLGNCLNFTAFITLGEVRSHFLGNVTWISRRHERRAGEFHLLYFQLRPSLQDPMFLPPDRKRVTNPEENFSAFVEYLQKKAIAAVGFCKNDVQTDILLLPSSDLTKELGVSDELQPVLHCIFLSKHSFAQRLSVLKDPSTANSYIPLSMYYPSMDRPDVLNPAVDTCYIPNSPMTLPDGFSSSAPSLLSFSALAPCFRTQYFQHSPGPHTGTATLSVQRHISSVWTTQSIHPQAQSGIFESKMFYNTC